MTMQIRGDGITYSPVDITDADSPYTTTGEEVIYVNSSGNAVEVELASADATDGHHKRIVDTGLAAGTNAITISTQGSETINPGANSSITIGVDGGYEDLWSDGSNWFVERAGEFDSVATGRATIGDGDAINQIEYGSESLDPGAAADSTTDTKNDASTAITFTTEFDSAPKVFVGIGSVTNFNIVPRASSVSTTGFTLTASNWSSSDPGTVTITWLAVG